MHTTNRLSKSARSAMSMIVLALALAGGPGAARAAEAVATDSRPLYEQGGLFDLGLVVGLKAGGGFGQVFSELGSTFVGELELGWVLPLLGRGVELFATGAYAGPSSEGEGEIDDRLPDGGPMTYEVTQRQAIVTLGLLYRLPLASDLMRPYLSLGGRMYLMRTEVSGEAGGEAFGANEETARELGFFGAIGGELYLGPGALLLEMQVGYSKLDGKVMQDTNTGSLNAVLGYRIFL